MAAGTPVVATAAGPPRDRWRARVEAISSHPGRSPSAPGRSGTLAEDPAERGDLWGRPYGACGPRRSPSRSTAPASTRSTAGSSPRRRQPAPWPPRHQGRSPSPLAALGSQAVTFHRVIGDPPQAGRRGSRDPWRTQQPIDAVGDHLGRPALVRSDHGEAHRHALDHDLTERLGDDRRVHEAVHPGQQTDRRRRRSR